MKKSLLEYAFYIFTIVIFIIFSLFLFRFLTRERESNELYTMYSLEKSLFWLYESYREGNLEEEIKEKSEIQGFGIYKYDGTAKVLFGSAPHRVESGALRKGWGFVRDSERGTITLIRPIGGGPEPPPMERGREHHRMRDLRRLRFVYIELAVGDYYTKNSQLTLFTFLYPFVLLAFLSSLFILYRKTMGYKKRMEEQRHLAQLGEVSRTLTHEMKNPLGAIRLQTGYLKRLLPEEYKGEMDVIEEETERLRLLSDRIGDFLRDPRGHVEEIDPHSFIERVISKFAGQITFNSRLESETVIAFDSQRLRSVLENLIKNGLESGGEDESAAVEVSINEERGRLYIKVADNGKGLPDGQGEAIFDPFYTTKTRGSGIGLAISKRFVEAVGGRLTLRNREQGGAEAVIELKREMK